MDFGYKDMESMIQRGLVAYDYAWLHYDELNARASCYALFGPPSNHLGVMAAGHLTPSRERKVQATTRRKRYTKYELDENFRVIRIKHIKDYTTVVCTYHLFELDGVTYARAFLGEEKIPYTQQAFAIKHTDGRPDYFAITQKNYLCVDFYEYPKKDLVQTNCYLYLPGGELSLPQYKLSWDVPFGTQNSPVTLDHSEEVYHHIDFRNLVQSLC